ncbi:hypothetical protein EYF80_044565 [Liparis tanakae]|uniref:Uncharacterized protein n=1 Tax=Liparis tanakae TaxID=230148 RepID=A0A4Z2FWE2_9TELE|nr:hypothetical protein EYF80_044565 [Liparis tanakae]
MGVAGPTHGGQVECCIIPDAADEGAEGVSERGTGVGSGHNRKWSRDHIKGTDSGAQKEPLQRAQAFLLLSTGGKAHVTSISPGFLLLSACESGRLGKMGETHCGKPMAGTAASWTLKLYIGFSMKESGA